MPLLRRPHDHCRELRARRRTPRPTSARRRGQYRDAMTPATASLHYPSTGTSRSRSRTTVAPALANPHARPLMVPNSNHQAQHRRPILRGGRRSALNHIARSVPLQSRCPIKSPYNDALLASPRGFLLRRLSNAGLHDGSTTLTTGRHPKPFTEPVVRFVRHWPAFRSRFFLSVTYLTLANRSLTYFYHVRHQQARTTSSDGTPRSHAEHSM
jgi:hypothetical protein